MTTIKETDPAGRPTLAKQAENAHTRAEIRVDLELGKLTLKAIKHLAKMVNNIDTYKENTQLALIDKVLRGNKDYMKAKRELELAGNPRNNDIEEEEDDTIMIQLSSSETESKQLN